MQKVERNGLIKMNHILKMKINHTIKLFSAACVFTVGLVSSCILPIMDIVNNVSFRNCTNDTLLIGASHYNNMDSIETALWSMNCDIRSSYTNDFDTVSYPVLEGPDFSFENRDIVFPDSICYIDESYMHDNFDTCYLFLIRWSDARKYSWDEIRANNKFYIQTVTKDDWGSYNTEIKYTNQ